MGDAFYFGPIEVPQMTDQSTLTVTCDNLSALGAVQVTKYALGEDGQKTPRCRGRAFHLPIGRIRTPANENQRQRDRTRHLCRPAHLWRRWKENHLYHPGKPPRPKAIPLRRRN